MQNLNVRPDARSVTRNFGRCARALAGGCSLAALAFLSMAMPAQAHGVSWAVGVGAPGVSVGVSNGGALYVGAQPVYAAAPVTYVAPPVVYAPPRVVYAAPPVVYAPPPVAYAPPPVYYGSNYYRPAPVYMPPVVYGGSWGHFHHHHDWR